MVAASASNPPDIIEYKIKLSVSRFEWFDISTMQKTIVQEIVKMTFPIFSFPKELKAHFIANETHTTNIIPIRAKA